MKDKHIPERKCTACKEKFPKPELLRVVKTPSGEILIDKTGKASGRGAYICKNSACLQKAHRRNALEAALETKISDEIYMLLEEELRK